LINQRKKEEEAGGRATGGVEGGVAPSNLIPVFHDVEPRLQCVAVCCSVLQRVVACYNVLQRVAACCSVLQRVAACHNVLQRVAVCWSETSNLIPVFNDAVPKLQCVAACCIVLQRVSACASVSQRDFETDSVFP